MRKTIYVLGMVALMATFTACNSAAENTDTKKVETADADAKCGEGKCGEGKCGGADAEGEKEDHFADIDTDGNGEITKEEFVVHVTKEFKSVDKNEDGKVTTEECGHFDMLNTDGDDLISSEEFEAGHDTMFSKMDKDGSGTVSREEMEAQMKAMKENTSDDAEKKCGDATAKDEKKCGEGKCGK
ncbi:MAG: EF-hand domain-containing protein [Bacteroidales bacterium]|nr:EF-hand domain-containing protein [Bacteroidales bacterium]